MNSNWEIVFFFKWKETVKWFAAILEYALINYKVYVILKHPGALQNLMGWGA